MQFKSIAALILLTAPLWGQAPVIEEWRTPLPTQDSRAMLALDSQDNVYVAHCPVGAFGARKFDTEGNLLWSSVHVTPFDDNGVWLAVDSADNVIIGGYRESANGGYMAAKWDPAGNFLWATVIPGWSSAEAFRVAVDAADNVYLTGHTIQATRDYLTMKIDAQGVFQWAQAKDFGQTDRPSSIAVTPAGRVVVTGKATSYFGTVCYDTNGNELWSATHPAIGGAMDVVLDAQGAAFVSGVAITGTSYAGAIAKYSATGVHEWTGLHNGPQGPWDLFRRLAVDSSGNVIGVGQMNGASWALDWSIVKFDTAGNLVWNQTYNGFELNEEFALGVATGPDDSVYVTGQAGPHSCSLGGFPWSVDTLTMKFDAAGNQIWQIAAGCSSITPFFVRLTTDGRVVINTGNDVIRYVQGPGLELIQPGGPGASVFVQNTNLHPGNEYFNVFSLQSCGAVGTGPYLGLCSSDPQLLVNQVLLPLGAVPFHFLAPAGEVTFGPYQVLPALTVDAICFELNGNVVGPTSTVQRLTVP